METQFQPIIFTEYYPSRLAKTGICFTFLPHKVRIKNYARPYRSVRSAGTFTAQDRRLYLNKGF